MTKRAQLLFLVTAAALATTAVAAQTAGFIYARPTNIPPTNTPEGVVRDNLNYIQGPDPILLSPGGDIAIVVNAGQCCDGHYEALFSLLYPQSGAGPQFFPIWAANNWGNDLSRNEHETGHPSAVYFGNQWRIGFTASFWCTANPGDPTCAALNDGRLGRVDVPNLFTQASPAQVNNTWVPPADPACAPLGACQGPGTANGGQPSFVVHATGDLYLYYIDETSSCASKRIRRRIAANMSVVTPEDCLVFHSSPGNMTYMDVARGADGAMYMVAVAGGGPLIVEEWKSVLEPGYSLGLYWRKTGRTWNAPGGAVAGFPGHGYGIWDPGYLTDPTGLLVEPRVVIAQISHAPPGDFPYLSDVTQGNWWFYYWADAGAYLPPNFGAPHVLAPSSLPAPHDYVWFDDQLPAGAQTDPGNHFRWDLAQRGGGVQSHTRHSGGPGIRQHYFYNASGTMTVQSGDRLVAYALINPFNPPRELMLQWKVGSGDQQWEHRAFWGENLIPWGTTGTASRYYMGPLPTLGKWLRLEVPAEAVGLAGQTLSGAAFTLYNGEVWFDRVGKAKPMIFYSITPCRIVDTRGPVGPDGYPALSANVPRTFALAGKCGVPGSAKALAANLTAVDASTVGGLVAYPGGQSPTTANMVSYRVTQARAGMAVVPLSAIGTASVLATQPSGTVHFILDVNGYFQ